MKRKIVVNEKALEIRLKRRRGMRRLALSIASDGSISLTAPKTTPLWFIERFLTKQAPWIERTLSRLGFSTEELEVKKKTDREHYLAHREAARRFVGTRLKELNANYRFRYTRISIRNQRSRWGSCSAAGTLSFNYRVLFLPEHLAEYVLTHELAHLQELNHGSRFWELVAKTIPAYKERRQELQQMKIGSGRARTIGED